jgi:5-methylthioadenosine/S-adenosylhomocysteine deaminase
MTITVIKDCDWIIAWDGAQHVYRRGGDVAFDGGRLVHVGGPYPGDADIALSGRGRMVMPGLVDLHSHPSTEPTYRGIREEHGSADMFQTGLYERSCAFGSDPESQLAAAEVAYCEVLLSGATTLSDLSRPYPGWLDLMARSGLRGFLAPWFASARWQMKSPTVLGFDWDEAAGLRQFDAALALIDQAIAHPSGRLGGVVFPAQIETCTPALFRDANAAALERGLPITTHIAQSVTEVLEILQRHGVTPVQYAADLGLLHPSMTLAHCIFIDDHSWLHLRSRRDLALLADSGAHVAHCPLPFARYGAVLEDFGRYRRAGVNIGIGTDTTPQNMIEELRWALTLCKTSTGDGAGTRLADVFHAATIGGAKALLRDDIGRLAPGCRADLVLVDLEQPWMMPARDPLRSLVFHAADRAVRDVFIDGAQVVRDGRVLTLDHADALGRLAEAQARIIRDTPNRDYQGRTADQIAPLTLPFG